MARKVFLWLVSAGLGAAVIYLSFWTLVAMFGDSVKPTTGYWRAIYCDVQGCPNGSRVITLEGFFIEGETQQCYLLQSRGVEFYDHQNYYLKEGSCEISKKPFKVDDAPKLTMTQELVNVIWIVLACMLSIPIYAFISGDKVGNLRRWVKRNDQPLWGLFGLTLVPGYVLAAGYKGLVFNIFLAIAVAVYLVYFLLVLIFKANRLEEKGGIYKEISGNLETIAICGTAIAVIFFLVPMMALAASPIPPTSPFFPFDQKYTNWYVYLFAGSGFILWGKRA